MSARSLGQNVTLACLLESAAPKVGNVHRGADFQNLSFYDFCSAAVSIAPAMELARETGVGRAALDAITATQTMAQGNVNLGIVLLLAPLAACDPSQPLTQQEVGQVLNTMTADDARQVYEAIQLAAPGAMGSVDDMDVGGQAPDDLLDAMNAAAHRDLVALQYVTQFELVLGEVRHLLIHYCQSLGIIQGIVRAHLACLARRPDTLIQRKCGAELALEVQHRAAAVMEADHLSDEDFERSLRDFDFWLRCDGHKRNPGTTADLIAAGLFAALRDDYLQWQGRW